MGGSIYTDKWNRTIYQYKFLSIKPFCCRQRKITSSRISMQWAQMTAVRANEVTNKKKERSRRRTDGFECNGIVSTHLIPT